MLADCSNIVLITGNNFNNADVRFRLLSRINIQYIYL